MITVCSLAYIEAMWGFDRMPSTGDILIYVSGPGRSMYTEGQIVKNLKCIKVFNRVGNTYYVHKEDDWDSRCTSWWKIRQRVCVFQCIDL